MRLKNKTQLHFSTQRVSSSYLNIHGDVEAVQLQLPFPVSLAVAPPPPSSASSSRDTDWEAFKMEHEIVAAPAAASQDKV